MKIVNSEIQPPPVDSVSTELRRLVTWLLQKDPNARPTVKEIMCEEVIQNKLMEHHLPLPEDLTGCPVTDRLGSTIRGTTGMSKGTRWDSEILTGDLDINGVRAIELMTRRPHL